MIKISLKTCLVIIVLITVTETINAWKYRHWTEYGASGHPFGRCLRHGKIVPCKFRPGPYGFVPTTFKPWPFQRMNSMTEATTTTTPPTTTTTTTTIAPITTEDPDIIQSNRIREEYSIARELSGENLFSFTEEESRKFTSRIFDEIEEPFQTCNKTYPKFTDCKVKELAYILRNNQCFLDGNLTTAAAFQASRKRRRRRQLATIRNPDGSVSRVVSCSKRGERTTNRGLRLCTTCFVITELPEGRFPRFINEATCDLQSFPSPGDRTCFFGNGQCVEQFVNLQFLRDEQNVGIQRLGRWRQYQQRVRSGCNCGMSPSSPLSIFVV